MLDNILNIVKEVAIDAIANNADVPSDKKDLTAQVATKAISNGFTDNISDLAGLFSGKSESNSIMDTIKDSVISSITEKVGLSSGVTSGLVASMLPAIISALTSKIGDKEDNGFSIESVLGALAGGDSKKGGGLGDALGALGKLFG